MGAETAVIMVVAVALGYPLKAILNMIKADDRINPKNIPYIALVIGGLVGAFVAPLFSVTMYVGLIGGFISGLSATGFYEFTTDRDKEDDI